MALPAVSPKTPGRTSDHYTVGNPKFNAGTDNIPSATAPNIGTAATTPRTVTLVGTDAQSGSATVGALSAGASSTLTIPIQLSGLPSGIILGPSDLGQFEVALTSVSHAISGLAVASVTLTPQAYTGSGVFSKEVLQSGLTYTGWGCSASVTVTAVGATSSGVVTVRVTAWLYDTLG